MHELAKRVFTFCLSACCLLAVSAVPSSGQEFNEVQAVINPQLQLERSRQIRQLIQRIGRDKFKQENALGSSTSFGADLGDNPPDDGASEERQTKNFWIDGSINRLEDSSPIRGYEGTQESYSIGLDRAVTDRLTLGLIGNYSESDVDNIFLPGNSTTEAISVGPYFAYFVTDTVVLTGSFLYRRAENGASSAGVIANYDSEGWAANASLTSYHFFGNALLAPSIGLSFDSEEDDAYVDSAATLFPSSTVRSSTFNFGLTASFSHVLPNGWTIDPSIGIEGEWTFDRSVDAPTSVTADTGEFDASVVVGAAVQISESMSLDFTGIYAGIGRSNYESFAGAVRLSLSY